MTTIDKVRNYILENFLFTSDPGALADDSSLLELGLIDSTGILELVFFVEENFGFKVADSDLIPENFDSVANIAKFVGARRKS